MRITSSLLNSYSYPWLTTLKASQLQRIAQATGIQSSGTKASLIERLSEELPAFSSPEPENHKSTCMSKGRDMGTGTGMSILSIDMGIQNLAYAHLLVSRDTATATTTPTGAAPASVTVKLNAWRRLAVSEALVTDFGSPSSSRKTKEASKQQVKGETKDKEKHTFSPPEYARTAYTLVSNLLHRYQPSHVLIERQRFRSGGGSAVQEWTLRVGVFEGMLYAVLHTLGCERREGDGARPGPVVLGVEPRRVGAYWEDRLGISSAFTSDGPKKKTSKEGKKVKINLAGEWLRAGMIMGGGDSGSGSGSLSPARLAVADDPDLRALVDAYLRRWEGKSNPRTSVSKVKTKAGEEAVAEDDGAVGVPPDVRKMDDLADCLVQGVTWLEWQAMRQRISTEGLDAVLQLESEKL
ncbi:hypothetical protein CNMCM5793_008268 [Aspergillus hiratsukae]|uniref:SAP domain-containing protein n=1 Tax=Aspergillus hiratsukae TaxID=1194566 RepID=A0A8H6U9M2_9EURO|nr:hypothetical protein CNMCM5793_008268 [Aspergillus hiratsukae]KAF7163898.1 hypothetical protein CNMCM6106_000670 [Aspergillus hiratsukae]